jgi:hypothetical protein
MAYNITKYHSNLAYYFQSKPLYLDDPTQKKPNTRKLVEQPWQLLKASKWQELKNLLEDNILFWIKKAEISNNLISETYRQWCNLADQAYEPFNIVQKIGERLVNITEINNNSQTIIIKGITDLIKIWNFNGVFFLCATENDVYSTDVQNGSSRHIASISKKSSIRDICIDANKLVVGVGLDNGGVQMYDYISGIKLNIFHFNTTGRLISLYFKEGKLAIIASGDFWAESGYLDLWDINSGIMLMRKIIPWSFNCLLLTPSNKLIWVNGEHNFHDVEL